MQQFDGLKVTYSTVYSFMRTECNLSLKQAEFQSVERNSPEKTQERHDRVHKWEQTDMDFLTNLVILDESAFHINMKRTRAWSKKGTPAVVTVEDIQNHMYDGSPVEVPAPRSYAGF